MRAIELAQLIKSGRYELNNSHVQGMAKISHNTQKDENIYNKRKEGEHGMNKHKHKCEVCKCSYEAKSDLTKHNTKIHAMHQCTICKAQKYGENKTNDHTKECKSKRDANRKENDRKDAEKKRAHPKYVNIYMHLMDETPDMVEKITNNK